MSRRATTIALTVEERRELQRRVRARTSSQQAARRARIVLRAAEGARNIDIAAELGITRHTVQQWRGRVAPRPVGGPGGGPPPPPPPGEGARRAGPGPGGGLPAPARVGGAGPPARAGP